MEEVDILETDLSWLDGIIAEEVESLQQTVKNKNDPSGRVFAGSVAEINWGGEVVTFKLKQGGYKLSEEARKNIGNGHRGINCSDETKYKISVANKGRKFTEEHKGKLRGRKLSEETKKRLSDLQKARKLSEETKRKISEAHRGRKRTSEHQEKLNASRRGKKSLNGSKAKMKQVMTPYGVIESIGAVKKVLVAHGHAPYALQTLLKRRPNEFYIIG